MQCDVRRITLSSGGALFCVWLSGNHFFLHQQETLQSTQASTAESSVEDGLASSLREVKPKEITFKSNCSSIYVHILYQFVWRFFFLFVQRATSLLYFLNLGDQ